MPNTFPKMPKISGVTNNWPRRPRNARGCGSGNRGSEITALYFSEEISIVAFACIRTNCSYRCDAYMPNYRAIHVSAKRGIAVVSRPSVCLPSACPSVTLMYRGHIGWTSSKLINK